MNKQRLLWIIWGVLLLGQIVLDVVAFPRWLGQPFITDRYIFGLVMVDVMGVGAWIFGWYTDQMATHPRSWHVYVIVVLCVVFSLMSIRAQFYAF